MYKALVLLLIFVASVSFGQVDENETPKKSSGISVGLAEGWLKYNNEDYYGALRIYKKLYPKAPDNATLNYRMGACMVELNKMDSAIILINKSLKLDSTINKNAYYMLGRAFQFKGELDLAIDNFYKYKTMLSPKQNERHFVNIYLRQCLTAKELMANPVNVKITNLGSNINSKYVDASPSVSADGKILIFTARRPENVGGKIDYYTEDYFDDLYISKYDDATKSWGKAENMGDPINTEFHDANLSISPDGKMIFIYKNQLNVTKSGDIYVSTLTTDGKWGKPKPIDEKNINSTYFESSASITADGKTLYFVSEREKEGYGKADIYVAKKEGKTWGKPVNIGPTINSIEDEIGVFIHPDGKTLFFSSNGHNTMGLHDIFMSTVDENGVWSKPVNLGYPINTTRDEIHFVLTTNRKTAYISSDREGGLGKNDIYEVDMRYYFKSNKDIDEQTAKKITGPPLCIFKGIISDAKTGDPIKTSIIVKNKKTGKSKVIMSNESGEYFATLPAGEEYIVSAKSKGYKTLTITVKLPEEKDGETPSVNKLLLLNKK